MLLRYFLCCAIFFFTVDILSTQHILIEFEIHSIIFKKTDFWSFPEIFGYQKYRDIGSIDKSVIMMQEISAAISMVEKVTPNLPPLPRSSCSPGRHTSGLTELRL